MREIELTKGKVALVDDEDFEFLSQWKWYANVGRGNSFYARHTLPRDSLDKRGALRMHNAIWERHHGPVPDSRTVDHIDLNGLNNQKSNLSLATATQQNRNKALQPRTTSGYLGVSRSYKDKWRSRITVDKKVIYLGYFNSAEDAARARDVASLLYFGNFANLNFPLDNN